MQSFSIVVSLKTIISKRFGVWQLVDDVEFLFSPGKKSTVEYRSASRKGNFDFDVNRKRIKVRNLDSEMVSVTATGWCLISLHSSM